MSDETVIHTAITDEVESTISDEDIKYMDDFIDISKSEDTKIKLKEMIYSLVYFHGFPLREAVDEVNKIASEQKIID